MQNQGCGWVAAIIAGALVAGGALLVLVQWLETVASPAGIVLVAVLIAAPVRYLVVVMVIHQLGGLRGPARATDPTGSEADGDRSEPPSSDADAPDESS